MKYLLTQDALTVSIDGKPYSISSSHRCFAEIRDAAVSGADPVRVLGLMQQEANRVKELVAETARRQRLTGTLEYDEGVIYYNGAPLHNYAVDTLIKFLNAGYDVSALAAFIDKQQQNPNPMVHAELYKFLEHGKIPLTPDGDFLVYKAVRADFRDIHSGSFDNSVGARPQMPYEGVDPNRHNTCSRGLHVCSYGYLPSFAHADGHVMICKVNPRDVVAIPADYNNTKMRVATYEVVGEVTDYYRRGEDVLASDRLADRRYEVQYVEDDTDDLLQVGDAFYTLEEARAEADSIWEEESSVQEVFVVDTLEDGKIVYQRAG